MRDIIEEAFGITPSGAAEPPAGVPYSPYPCTSDVTCKVQVKGTIYTFPEGDSELVLHESVVHDDDDDDADSLDGDDSPREPRQHWVWSNTPIPSGCPRSRYVATLPDTYARFTTYGIERRHCPWLTLGNIIESEQRCGRRARSQVRRLSRSNGMRYMSTFTLPTTGARDRAACLRLIQAFIRTRFGAAAYRDGWIVVLEPHKRDGYHIHVLHPNFLKAGLMRFAWTRFILARGYTLPASRKVAQTHEKDWGTVRRAAHYASKYVTKSFGVNDRERERGQHRYLRPQDMVDCGRPIEFGSWEAAVAWVRSRPGSRSVSSYQKPDYAPVPWLWAAFDSG